MSLNQLKEKRPPRSTEDLLRIQGKHLYRLTHACEILVSALKSYEQSEYPAIAREALKRYRKWTKQDDTLGL